MTLKGLGLLQVLFLFIRVFNTVLYEVMELQQKGIDMVLFGIPKRSGRYPWGKQPEPNEVGFEARLKQLISSAKLQGVSDESIARIFADALSYYHQRGEF